MKKKQRSYERDAVHLSVSTRVLHHSTPSMNELNVSIRREPNRIGRRTFFFFRTSRIIYWLFIITIKQFPHPDISQQQRARENDLY